MVIVSDMKYLIVSTTVSKKIEAERISNKLLADKLSACTQIIGPITSIYKWQGKKIKAKEWLCLIKTAAVKYKKVEQVIKALHPYELPEIIALPISTGSKEYLNWLNQTG